MDPFRAVQEEVRGTLTSIQSELTKWQRIPAKSPKSEPARQRILSALSELQVDLQDMQATIDIALRDPAKFALTPSELMTRQDFVRDLQAQANDAQELVESPAEQQEASSRLAARGAAQKNDRQSLITSGTRDSLDPDLESSSAASRRGEGSSAAWQENEAATQGLQQQMQQIDRQQEGELSMIATSVDRLGEMGRVINQELKQQGKDLDAFTGEVEDVSGKMHQATAVMKKMLKNKDRGKLCTILVLTIVFILLAYAVLAW